MDSFTSPFPPAQSAITANNDAAQSLDKQFVPAAKTGTFAASTDAALAKSGPGALFSPKGVVSSKRYEQTSTLSQPSTTTTSIATTLPAADHGVCIVTVLV